MTKADMITLVRNRFSGVPEITEADIDGVVTEALAVHGMGDEFDGAELPMLMAYASAEMAQKIALNTAWYFSFSDGEESVDKTMVTDKYRNLANDYRQTYERHRMQSERAARKSRFRNMHRIDRPPFDWM